MAAFKDAFLKTLDAMAPLPKLGPADKILQVEFSEADLDALAFATGFALHALSSSRMKRILNHYGPTLEALKKRFETPKVKSSSS
jgi:hypothetical protein